MSSIQDAERILSPEVEAAIAEHPGKYVAVTYSALLAFGDDPKDVLARARELSPDEVPLLFRVPAEQDRAYFF